MCANERERRADETFGMKMKTRLVSLNNRFPFNAPPVLTCMLQDQKDERRNTHMEE